MNEILCCRVILAAERGSSLPERGELVPGLPEGCTVFSARDFPEAGSLEQPFSVIPVLPHRGAYRGQIIGLLVGPDWATLDGTVPILPQEGAADTIPVGAVGATHTDATPMEKDDEEDDAYEIVEGIYRTGLQLHMADAPLWATAVSAGKGVQITLPCQWPHHVRITVASALGIPVRSVHLTALAPSGNRDGALILPSHLAALAALAAQRLGSSVTLGLRNDQLFLSGGRSPSEIRWATRMTAEGTMLSSVISIAMNLGAYAILRDETTTRLRIAATSVYRPIPTHYSAQLSTTADLPMSAFEGVGSAQVSFARELHWNRLAEIAQQDPISWRTRHLRTDWPVLDDICETLAEESDFHRRYSANELIKKRRIQLPRDSAALRGIGAALGEQQSGMTGNRESGAVTIRLNQDGTANLFCTIPSPSLRLRQAWRQIVAQELEMEREAVILDEQYDSSVHDSGPRAFSRGASLVPRAITLACQSIRKRRFRDPLPITVRRAIKAGTGSRSPAEALLSVGGAAVEAVLRPATMEIDIRSVTMAIYAGRILDRGMAEAELRRGIYHALNWTLHESLLDPELATDPATLRSYTTAFRGSVPRIRIVFLPQIRRDGPSGISEIPFNTVPAALVSALSQATGLYLDTIPVRPAHILRLLQEE